MCAGVHRNMHRCIYLGSHRYSHRDMIRHAHTQTRTNTHVHACPAEGVYKGFRWRNARPNLGGSKRA